MSLIMGKLHCSNDICSYIRYWIHSAGAKKAREVVFTVLQDACIDGDLLIPEAVEAAENIFAKNAIQFYKMNVATNPIDIKNAISPKIMNIGYNSSRNDIALVRIIWVDASGQQRCRVSLPSIFLVIYLFAYFFLYLNNMMVIALQFNWLVKLLFESISSL